MKYLKTQDPEFMKIFKKVYIDAYNDIAKLPGFPEGLDLENCEIVFVADDYVQIEAGGDWQTLVPFSFYVEADTNNPTIGGLYESPPSKSHAKEINAYMKQIKELFPDTLKESISNKLIKLYLRRPDSAVKEGRFYWEVPDYDSSVIHGGLITNLDPPDNLISVECDTCHEECSCDDSDLPQKWWNDAQLYLLDHPKNASNPDLIHFLKDHEDELLREQISSNYYKNGGPTRDQVEHTTFDTMGTKEDSIQFANGFDLSEVYKAPGFHTHRAKIMTSLIEHKSKCWCPKCESDNIMQAKCKTGSIQCLDCKFVIEDKSKGNPFWHESYQIREDKEVHIVEDYDEYCKLSEDGDGGGISGGGVGLSGDFQAHAPENALTVTGLGMPGNHLSKAPRGLVTDEWDSAYNSLLSLQEELHHLIDDVYLK